MLHPKYYPVFGAKYPAERSWKEVLDEITSTHNLVYKNTLASRQARADGRNRDADKLKAACGMITPCGRCQGERKGENLQALTMVGMVDIDHIPADAMAEALRRVKADQHTLLAHVTNSQQGIRVFFPYQVVNTDGEPMPDEAFAFHAGQEEHTDYLQRIASVYRAAWEVGTRHFAELTGFPTDKSCKDAVRVSFLCHDPEAYLNEQAEPITITNADVQPFVGNPRQASATDHTHAAPVRKDQLLQARVLESINFRLDEGLIERLLADHAYTPGNRHAFWLKLGFRLRHYGHSVYELDAYRQAAQQFLADRSLITADDPQYRLPHEVEDALQYGYDHGQEGNEEWLRGYQQRMGYRATDQLNAQPSAADAPCPTSSLAQGDITDEDLISAQCPMFPDSVYRFLPEELWKALAPVNDAVEGGLLPRRRRDFLLMSCIGNYSALCAGTQLLYGANSYSPNIAFMGLSEAGNGKSVMSYAFRLVEKVDNYLEETSRQAHKEWQKEMDAYQLAMQDKKLRREEKEELERPDDEPQERLLVMPGTTSRSQFTLCMNAMGRDGLIINSTEIQTLVSTLKLDVGDFSDLLCKAMANERIDQFFKVDNRRIKIEKPKLSACLSGTFDQFHNFIPSYENGLFSRFAYLMMEPHLEWIPQQPNAEHGDYEREYQALALDALHMWLTLQKCPTWVEFSDAQWQRHSLTWSKQLGSLVREGGEDRISIVNRHGLLHARIAAVLTVLRKWNEYKRVAAEMHLRDDKDQERMTQIFAREHEHVVCRDDDFETARQMAEVLLSHALHLSTTMVVHVNRNVQPMQEWPWAMKCANELTDTFSSQDFVERAQKSFGRSRSQAFRSLRALTRESTVLRGLRGFYMKSDVLRKMATPPKCD